MTSSKPSTRTTSAIGPCGSISTSSPAPSAPSYSPGVHTDPRTRRAAFFERYFRMPHESKSASPSKAYASRWIIGGWLPLELWIAQPRLHGLRSAFKYWAPERPEPPSAGRRDRVSEAMRRLDNLYRSFAAVLVLIACIRIALTYSVFNHTFDEPDHIAAGIEWLDRGLYTYDQIHPPPARLAVA